MSVSSFQKSTRDNQGASQSISRRKALAWSAVWGTALASAGCTSPQVRDRPEAKGAAAASARKKVLRCKKSINLWAFPYPKDMSLEKCFELAKKAGFDGVEVNFDLEGDISPRAGEKQIRQIGERARTAGLQISGLCSFLFWPYPLSANDPATRSRGLELARQMIRAAHWLGTPNLLVVPGAVYIPWIEDSEEVPYDLVDRRAKEAIELLLPLAEKYRVSLNIENIFFNGYLMSPPEMIAFVDYFKSPWVNVHFDTGNIMPFQFPEHWIPLLGHRIRNVHLKEFSKQGTDFSLQGFRPLLDGTTNWPGVMDAFEKIGYSGFLTFEYFHPYRYYPEALIYHASDSMDRMLGRKSG